MTDPPTAEDLLPIALDLAHKAGRVLREQAGTATLAATKSSPTDAVTEVDRQVEQLILDGIAEARPDDAVLGEEGAAREGTTGIRWVVDPLDGTVNYLYGHPSGWSVSIAAEDSDGSLVGVVHDPARLETFVAGRDIGAFLNGESIRVSRCDDPASALVGTGFAYVAERREEQAQVLLHVLPRIRDIRRVGSAALELSWVACGRLDAFYEWGLGHWDWAAGSLIVTEAGGRFSHDDDGLVIAGPPVLAAQLRRLLRR